MIDDKAFEAKLQKFLDEIELKNSETRATIKQSMLEVREQNRQKGLDENPSTEYFLSLWEMAQKKFPPDARRALETYGKGPRKL
ncbi:MAG: hypothetical protein ACD_18C00347G0024 [uncultured bacterium]|nr:MAG: hypothetical protein ACD_18C00347G0024 [uncultured bacterium]OGH84789.1 MAG: hypothetical protein A2488_01270 [Candidatus Magasanikbacteria bacterium RIFOXYC12_FULL_32_21b]HAO52014.1 hypothetical protein [Candidatus Magasanikbacteria bacterium]